MLGCCVFIEGLYVTFFSADGERARLLGSALPRLCLVYALEALLALGPGWCAMDGWTCREVLDHHVPYIVAVAIAKSAGLLAPWSATCCLTLLTSANEACLVLVALGAPEWLAKARRLYGFAIVLALAVSELAGYFARMVEYWRAGLKDALVPALCTQPMLGAMAYHLDLLRLYFRRWQKTKTL